MQYRCPYCGITYEHEALTRAHITGSEDWDHINEHGYSSETEVEVIDDSGDIVDTLIKHRDEVDFNSLTPDDLPDKYGEEEKLDLIRMAYFPEVINYQLGDDTISLPEVRQFFIPQLFDDPPAIPFGQEANPPSLGDFTPMQQAILIAKICLDLDDAEIAELTDSAPTYPEEVYEMAANECPESIERIQHQVEDGVSIEEVLQAELSDRNLLELKDKGYLGVLPIDLEYHPQI